MANFSKTSEARLSTCHPDLQAVCRELIKQYDFSVLCGHRGKAEQNAAFEAGNSQLIYPQSAHNKKPSQAVDIAPYPIEWGNLSRFREMWQRFEAVANVLRGRGEIESYFKWGGDWTSFKDYPHIEIKEK